MEAATAQAQEILTKYQTLAAPLQQITAKENTLQTLTTDPMTGAAAEPKHINGNLEEDWAKRDLDVFQQLEDLAHEMSLMATPDPSET